MAQKITSLQNPLIKSLVKKLAEHNNLMLIESFKVIQEIINSHNFNIKHIFVLHAWYDQNKAWLNDYQEQVIICSPEIIKKITNVKSINNIILVIEYHVQNFKINKDIGKYLILDKIQNPLNMANILRTALAFGFFYLFISKDSVSLFNEKVIRGNMGSIFKLQINYYDNLLDLISLLQSHKIRVIATCLSKKSHKLHQFKNHFKNIALLFGNESKGLPSEAIKLSNEQLFIEIKNIDSLNVSSAFSIFLFWFSLEH